MERRYTITVYTEDGHHYARVAEMPGCLADGPTLDTVLVDVGQAMAAWQHASKETHGKDNHNG
jgi:predicted RNase H-like HicB family nuclease